MRNILEYPITVEEKLKALDAAIAHFVDVQGVGGIEALAILEVKDDFKSRNISPAFDSEAS